MPGSAPPGISMAMTAAARSGSSAEEAIKTVLPGHLCRCTGYVNIRKSIREGLAGADEVSTSLPTPRSLVGQRVLRVQDPRLLSGGGQYLDDLNEEGVLDAAVVRSSDAHGRLVKFDPSAALELEGSSRLTPEQVSAETESLKCVWIYPASAGTAIRSCRPWSVRRRAARPRDCGEPGDRRGRTGLDRDRDRAVRRC